MIFRGLIIVCAALGWMGDSLAAAPSACPPYAKPIVVDFTTHASDPIYNHSLNVMGIRNLFLSRGQTLSGPHARALGITYVETVLSLKGQSSLVPHQGGYCLYLTNVAANFGWERLEVYVASELMKDSCAYNAVLDHENQHVSINRATLREYAPQVRAALEEILRAQPPVFTTDTTHATNDILGAIQQRMNAATNAFQSTMSARNATIDTASNYGATAALCKDWGGTDKGR